jgi:2-iminobutanoate/2-iminopropanoate deaminase
MEKQIIENKKGPKPIGPYSPAIRFGNLVFISGQGPVNPDTGEFMPGDIRAETALTMENLKTVLEQARSSLSRVLSVTIILKDLHHFDEMNGIYKTYFNNGLPSRTCFEASNLLGGSKIELNAIAYVEES